MPTQYVRGEVDTRGLSIFTDWLNDYKKQKLHEQLAQSELENNAIKHQLLQQELETGALKTQEFKDQAPNRAAMANLALAQGQQEMQNTKLKGDLLQHELSRLPFEDAKAEDLHRVAMEQSKAQLEKLGVDTATAKIRQQFEAPMLAMQLQGMQQDMVASKQKTNMMQVEQQKMKSEMAHQNLATAMDIYHNSQPGEFEIIRDNVMKTSPEVGVYLQGLTGREPVAKSPSEFIGRMMSNLAARAGQGDQMAAKSLADLTAGLQTDWKTTKTDRLGQTHTSTDFADTAKAMTGIISSAFKAMNKGGSTATTQPSAPLPTASQVLMNENTRPGASSSAAPAQNVDDVLNRVDYHINKNASAANKSFFSNSNESDVRNFMENAPRDTKFTVSGEGDVANQDEYNKSGTLDKLFAGFNPLENDRGDAKLFKTMIVKDKAATAGQQARYQAALGLVAKQLSDPNRTDESMQETVLELLKRLNVGTDGLTPAQASSIAAFGKHFGLNIGA